MLRVSCAVALKLYQISGLGTGSGRCAILNVASPVDRAAFRGGWASFFGGWPSLSTPSTHERPASMITDDKAPALEDALRNQPLFTTRSLADAADALAGAAGPLLILGLRNAKAAEHTATRPNGSRTLSRRLPHFSRPATDAVMRACAIQRGPRLWCADVARLSCQEATACRSPHACLSVIVRHSFSGQAPCKAARQPIAVSGSPAACAQRAGRSPLSLTPHALRRHLAPSLSPDAPRTGP